MVLLQRHLLAARRSALQRANEGSLTRLTRAKERRFFSGEAQPEKDEKSSGWETARDVIGFLVLSIGSGGFLIWDTKDLGLPQKKKKKGGDDDF